MEEEGRWQDLPEDCWELVFESLKSHRNPRYQHFESLSLVCKRFLSISNRLRSSLNITDPLIIDGSLSVLLFRRFRNLNRIDLVDFHDDLDRILTQISRSGLNLQALNISEQKMVPELGLKELGLKMKNSLKILIGARLGVLLDKDLMIIADSLPNLEELDISFPEQDFRNFPKPQPKPDPFPFTAFGSFFNPLSDSGIAALTFKLPNLRKINVSGIRFISIHSVLSISSNCVFITDITAPNSLFTSEDAIRSVICNSPHLVSFAADGSGLVSISPPLSPPSFTIPSSLSPSKNLSYLDFSKLLISDEFLFILREADLPLKKLVLSCSRGFTINGIDSFLCAYRSLNYLDLQGIDFLTDKAISDLSQYMHELKFIGLSSCSKLTILTFFTLVRNCLSLQEIRMESTNLGKVDFPTEFVGKNLAIRSLKFACNSHLNDKTLKEIGLVCPKLESLSVSGCLGITEHGILEIGKTCSEIREVEMVGCRRICDFLVTGTEFFKLEVLNATSSGINDRGLSTIGYNCIGLQRLVLECCFGITEKGVKEVVEKCKRLRELNLKNCSMVSVDILSWMVFSRPSLRKIIPPRGFVPGNKQRDLFLRHGCMVCKG